MRKERYSLRKSKLGTVSALVGLSIVGGLALGGAEVHAAEEKTPEVKKTKPVTVTEDQVNKAKTDLDNTQKLVDTNTNDLNALNKNVGDTKTNISKLEEDIKKGKDAEKTFTEQDGIVNTKTTEKTDVTNKLNDANRDNNDAKNDVNNKKRDLDDATNDSNRAKNDVDKYTNITEPTPDEIKKNKDDIKKLTDDETRVNNDIQNKERTLQDKKDTADRDRIRRADLVRDRDNTQRLVDTDTTNRDRIDKEVKRLEKRLADGFPYPLTFNSTSEWNDLFKEYMKWYPTENNPYDKPLSELGKKLARSEITREQYDRDYEAGYKLFLKWFDERRDKLREITPKLVDAEHRLPEAPTINPPQEDEDETYDATRISDLNDDLLLDLNQYFVNLLNTTQRTLGFNQGVKLNKNVINFAKDIAKEYEKEHYKGDGHFGRGINNVARKWGLDATGQFYENLMTSEYWGEYNGTNVSKAKLYETVHKWFHTFFHEGRIIGGYGHATSLVQKQNLGISFSWVDGILRMHVISVKDPSFIDMDKDGDGWPDEDEKKEQEKIWNEKYGPNSKDNLPVKDFSTNGVDINHLTNLRTQVADLNNAIKTNQDKVDNFIRDIKVIDDRKDDVTNATNDLNKSKDELRDITTKKTDALNLERKLQDQITDARNKKRLRDDAVREYNRLEQIRKDKERDYNDALNRQKQTQKKVDELTDQLKNLNDAIDDATKKRDDAQRLKDQVPTLEKRLEDEKKRLEQLNKDIKDKKDELEKNKKDLETKEKEYTFLKNIFDLDKMLKLSEDEDDDSIISGKPKVAPTDEDLPKVDIKEETKEEVIPYKVIERQDPTLRAGQRVVKVVGKNGKKTVKTTQFSVNGQVVDTKTDETVLEEAVDQIVLVGTKKTTNVKVEVRDTYRTDKYPYQVIVRQDPTLLRGQRVVKVVGAAGERVYRVTTTLEDGVVVNTRETLLSTQNPIDEIILEGTRDLKPGQRANRIEVRNGRLPYRTITRNNPNLELGQVKVVQRGVEGTFKVVRDDIYEGETLVEKGTEFEIERVESINEIIEIGTKKSRQDEIKPPKKDEETPRPPKKDERRNNPLVNDEKQPRSEEKTSPRTNGEVRHLPNTDADATNAAGAGVIGLVAAAIVAKRRKENK